MPIGLNVHAGNAVCRHPRRGRGSPIRPTPHLLMLWAAAPRRLPMQQVHPEPVKKVQDPGSSTVSKPTASAAPSPRPSLSLCVCCLGAPAPAALRSTCRCRPTRLQIEQHQRDSHGLCLCLHGPLYMAPTGCARLCCVDAVAVPLGPNHDVRRLVRVLVRRPRRAQVDDVVAAA